MNFTHADSKIVQLTLNVQAHTIQWNWKQTKQRWKTVAVNQCSVIWNRKVALSRWPLAWRRCRCRRVDIRLL